MAHSLESTLEKVARIIARRRGVTVELRGGSAYVDLEKMSIVLPQVSDEQHKHMAPYLDGICDHECGHVLWTDKDAVKGSAANLPLHTLTNVLEDFRTEALTSAEYIGCAQNLRAMNKHFTGWWEREAWAKADALGKLMFGLGCRLRGDKLTKINLDADPTVGALLQALAPEIAEARAGLASTAACLELAKRMLEKIKSMAQPPESKPKPQKGDAGEGEENEDESDGGQGDSEQSDDGDSEADSDGGDSGDNSEDGDSKPKGKGSKSEDEGAGDDSEDGEDETDGDADGDEGDSDEDADADDTEDGDSGDAGDKADGEEADGEAARQAENFQDGVDNDSFEKPADLDAMVREDIKGDVRRGSDGPADYVVFSEQYDTETRYTDDDRIAYSKEYHKIRESVRSHIGTMAQALEAALAAEAESCWVGGERLGRRFDRRRMASWVAGSDDDRIFQRLEEGENLDTAVCLLWDCSGSMGSSSVASNKAALARIAAVAFHEALTRAGIAHEVLGFNTGGGVSPELNLLVREAEKRGEDLTRYSRLMELDNRMVFVDFGQTDGRAICAITGGHANRDGEAVLWAARRLAARPERRKILIVGSDGQPAGARYGGTERRYLQEVVERVIQAGIEVVGIGIMDESVKQYYPTNVTIRTARDLPRVVMGELTNLLLKGTSNASKVRRASE